MVATHKKPKKSSITKGAAASALDASDQDALSRRAARFQREHEIEKQKQRANQRVTFRSASHYTRAVTPGMFGGDDPEVDPVRRVVVYSVSPLPTCSPRMCPIGIVILLLEPIKAF